MKTNVYLPHTNNPTVITPELVLSVLTQQITAAARKKYAQLFETAHQLLMAPRSNAELVLCLMYLQHRLHPEQLCIPIPLPIHIEAESIDSFAKHILELQKSGTGEANIVRMFKIGVTDSIEWLWRNSGNTIHSTVVEYHCNGEVYCVDIGFAAYIIAQDPLNHSSSPINKLSWTVLRLNRQRDVGLPESIKNWLDLMKKLPEEVQTEATCCLAGMLARIFITPGFTIGE